ncbi:putative glutathione S-transferase [Streptococcus gallinaceus]|uniref:glutathione S-transferase family protein n=1 Tax=Streptococcus gallinaceus TaxID=165758 RepID=UPI00209E881B|nr:glutathione S-transferase family protein [Streptococcus gallinaceus]MCP1639927.1 putative glutathione S-transferase [Streptococcus gallinaceus]MCP1770701.1 putative glutathione S-transferase [Streptococcus gallinaceus]
MGLLVEGKWVDQWYDTKKSGGRFVRTNALFRNWITADGSAGPTGVGGYQAEAGRYHLYVSLACPWASRTLMMRALKGLEDMISVSVVHPLMLENGWTFADGPGVVADPILEADYLHEIYTHVQPDYTGRVTVPVLYDKKTDTIVSNESADIIRMFNSAFDQIGVKKGDYALAALLDEIDAMNETIYHAVNNGVYKVGFATDQAVYEEELGHLFAALDELEALLSTQEYLVGNQFTEADIRLFTTLVRFDAVYYGHFKCNLKRLVDYPHLWQYTKKIYHMPGIAATVDFGHIKQHYYGSHKTINPNGIVPVGPLLDWNL